MELKDFQQAVLETLRTHLSSERNRLAEALFLADVAAGRIQFRLRTDSHNWKRNVPAPSGSRTSPSGAT